jgi:glycogenin glucosyltransferase
MINSGFTRIVDYFWHILSISPLRALQIDLFLSGRPDLTTVLTKLHIFRLTQYQKIIFLDADVLPIRSISHLFNLPHEFSAVPDVGWPDIFNSGVLVLSPGEDKFNQLNELLKSKGSWDGGDQGILNEWRGGDWNRLSFTYNTTPTAAYTSVPLSLLSLWQHLILKFSYAPAYERYGSQISAIHFIGKNKPWNSISSRPPFSNREPSRLDSPQQSYDYESLVDKWFDVYDKYYRSEPIIPQSSFGLRRYSSAWDEKAATEEAGPKTLDSRPVFGLEDLRTLAIEGLSKSTVTSFGNLFGHGEYRSMPLEGRIDLMRPRKDPELKESVSTQAEDVKKAQDKVPVQSVLSELFDLNLQETSVTPRSATALLPQDISRWHTLRTPGPTEIPSSPRLRVVSLPSTPTPQSRFEVHVASSNVYPIDKKPEDRSNPHEYFGEGQPRHHHHGQHERHTQYGHQDSNMQQQYTPAYFDVQQQAIPASSDVQQQYTSVQHTQQHQQHKGQAEAPAYPQFRLRDGEENQRTEPQNHELSRQGEPQRPSSPPMMVWNAAVDPPPTTNPPPSVFPTDTYFPNVWDKTPSRQNDQTQSGPSPPDSAGFFQSPPPSEIPASLLQQGHYRNVTGESPLGVNPSPDRAKVKNVFPWEEKLRQLPARVFPVSDAPPPALFLSPESLSQASTAAPSTPEAAITRPRIQPLSPLYGLPSSLTYANAWDTVPSIQKYASQLVRQPQPPPLAPAFDEDGWRKDRRKSRDEQAEVNSRDGDDEDNADDDDDEPAAANSDGESVKSTSNRRSRSGSLTSHSRKPKKKEYRQFGVQTIPREKREQAVQAVQDPPPPLKQEKEKKATMHSKRQWAPSSGSNLLAPTTIHEMSNGHDSRMKSTTNAEAKFLPVSEPSHPTLLKLSSLSTAQPRSPIRSPREFVVSPSATGPPARPLLSPASKPSVRTSAITTAKLPSLIARQSSNESSLNSPASSAGPISPSDSSPINLAMKKAGRVWDPARGVELFKRGSEEVLARFLKMGSWEDESAR